jgi:hypothetical protein
VLKHRLSLDLVPAVDTVRRGNIFVPNLAIKDNTGRQVPGRLFATPGGLRLFR